MFPVQVQILWEDGFNQVAPFELLGGLPRLDSLELEQRRQQQAAPEPVAHVSVADAPEQSAAAKILAGARAR